MNRSLIVSMAVALVSFAGGFALVRVAAPTPKRPEGLSSPVLADVGPALKQRGDSNSPLPADSGRIQQAGRQPPALLTNWASVDSADLRQLAANLRLMGCPVDCVADIVRGKLTRANATNYAAVARWGNFSDPRARWMQRRADKAALDKRLDAMMYDELGLARPASSPSLLFTAEQEQAIAEVRLQFPAVRVDSTNPETIAAAQTNRAARLQALATSLSPEALRNYKLDREGDGARIAMWLQGLQPTKSEFLAVADALDWGDPSFARVGTRVGVIPEVAAALQSALGADRFAQWQELQTPAYRAITIFAQVYQLSAETRAALLRLRKGLETTDPEEYKKQVSTLLVQPELVTRYLSNSQIHPASPRQ